MLTFCASVRGRCSATAASRSFWRNRSIASSYAVFGPSPDIARASIALGARGAAEVSLVPSPLPCSARFAHNFVYNLVTRGRRLALARMPHQPQPELLVDQIEIGRAHV